MPVTKCDECDGSMPVPDDALSGEIVTCAECGASFELVAASGGGDGGGFSLKPADTVGEDWGQ